MEIDTLPNANLLDSEKPSTSKDILISNENSSRLGSCEVCAIIEAKYTCPRCEVKTCSLKCSTIHKKELECDGSRDRAKFIPLNKFTNLDLTSDYRLLEEITRTLDNCRKERRNYSRDNTIQLPHHLFKLKNSTLKRKTIIKFLPFNFERRQKNSTRLNFHKDIIFWHVEWIFPNAENIRMQDEKVRETEKLCTILNKYLLKQEDKILQEKLQYYQAAGLPGIRLFLRAEGKPGRKFYELDPTSTLRECFRGKVIIEFPIIEVVLKDHVNDLNVIDTDDEDSEECNNKFGNQVINSIIKKSESDDSIYTSLKNLLFISEHSSGEMSE